MTVLPWRDDTELSNTSRSFRQALNEAKKQNHNLLERAQGMQNDLSDAEVRRAELEGQVRTGHTVGWTSL